jgi:hypothetical protein
MKDRTGKMIHVGDRIKVVEISPADKDPSTPDDPEMRTHELFRFCLGKVFTVTGFDKRQSVEVRADRNRELRKKFGSWHTIFLEPHEVEVVRRKRG